jgi:hypothetical protein
VTENFLLARNVNTRFAAHAALPFALLLVLTLAQGGSCRKGSAEANAAKASSPSASKASNAAADASATTPATAPTSNAAAAAAGASSDADVAGKGEASVNKSSETTGGGDNDVAAGLWGGQHVRLEVSADGAEIEFDCAHGRINGRLRPGADGRFDAAGTFVAERGGPVREGAAEKGQPARYTGRVKGKTMTLNVHLTDSNADAGTFTLTHGREPELTKCR